MPTEGRIRLYKNLFASEITCFFFSLAIVAKRDLELVQFDIRTVFLHGELKEDIYIELPEGLKRENSQDVVCKLNKSLYGLKQATRC